MLVGKTKGSRFLDYACYSLIIIEICLYAYGPDYWTRSGATVLQRFQLRPGFWTYAYKQICSSS